MRKAVRVILILLLLGILVFASYMAIKEVREYEEAEKLYEDLQEEFVETKPTEDTEPDETTEQTEPVEVAPITVDFTSLLEQNSDVVGWIYCQDTPINYPVVQAEDNDRYLRRDLNGKLSEGCGHSARLKCYGRRCRWLGKLEGRIVETTAGTVDSIFRQDNPGKPVRFRLNFRQWQWNENDDPCGQ